MVKIPLGWWSKKEDREGAIEALRKQRHALRMATERAIAASTVHVKEVKTDDS